MLCLSNKAGGGNDKKSRIRKENVLLEEDRFQMVTHHLIFQACPGLIPVQGFNFDLIISSTNLTIFYHGANSSRETLAVFYSTNSLDWVLKERGGRGAVDSYIVVLEASAGSSDHDRLAGVFPSNDINQ